MDYNELIEQVLQQSTGTVTRRVLDADIDTVLFSLPTKEDKLKSYRMQGEYGQKKFIKP